MNTDGSIDCARVPKTIPIATLDGRLLLNAAGREIRIPNVAGPVQCFPNLSFALRQAWSTRAAQLQNADARQRGLPIPPDPIVIQGLQSAPAK